MKKTSISIVGSGNVATHLAIAFHQAGHEIRQVLSRTYTHAQQLALRVGAKPTDNISSIDTTVEACLLCVGDDALYDLGLDLHLRNSLVIHTSGATPATVLKRVCPRYGVVWSPQTFIKDIAMDYSRLPLCIEGCNDSTEKEIETLFSGISNYIYHLDGEQRRQAHLAAVMVNNFVNAINATAQEYMEQHNLDFEMLRPLAEQTLRKWDFGNLWAQQTGPASRGDAKTLDSQRRMLNDQPELLKLYDTLTGLIQSK